MRKIGKKIVREKRMSREKYIWLWIRKLERRWRRLNRVVMVELFKIVKQRVEEKKDVVGVSCLKDESGAVKVSVDDEKKIWKEHMENVKNVEN